MPPPTIPKPSRARAAALLCAASVLAVPTPTAQAPTAPAPTAPAPADSRPSWTAAPAPGGRKAPTAEDRSSFYLEGAPGSVLEDKLTVVNPGDRRLTVELSGSDPWISLAAGRVSVPPRTRADVPLTVTVPAGTAPGDRSAAVTASGDGRRVRVPMAVRVAGTAFAALSVEHVRVSGTGRDAVIHYALVNRGNIALAPRLTIRAEGLFGQVLRREAAGVPAALAPGESVRLAERWPEAPRLDRVAVRVTATTPDGTRAAASGAYTPLPWLGPALAGAAGLVAAGAAVRLVRRRRAVRS
ncbi:COG1470 family protein [Streptomyces hesseae]|uniref:DUF916 domain-containing protein n=1 Tax=Streptomyces hesseae TaxID=3075519 RepID=A0ABU2SIN0_9ACTN|nr:hypothetical protein [Streptomyces sp. DSM 40473]MDT0448638.1 hypothetical protein [Streptomyces sp. DSM 40473]